MVLTGQRVREIVTEMMQATVADAQNTLGTIIQDNVGKAEALKAEMEQKKEEMQNAMIQAYQRCDQSVHSINSLNDETNRKFKLVEEKLTEMQGVSERMTAKLEGENQTLIGKLQERFAEFDQLEMKLKEEF